MGTAASDPEPGADLRHREAVGLSREQLEDVQHAVCGLDGEASQSVITYVNRGSWPTTVIHTRPPSQRSPWRLWGVGTAIRDPTDSNPPARPKLAATWCPGPNCALNSRTARLNRPGRPRMAVPAFARGRCGVLSQMFLEPTGTSYGTTLSFPLTSSVADRAVVRAGADRSWPPERASSPPPRSASSSAPRTSSRRDPEHDVEHCPRRRLSDPRASEIRRELPAGSGRRTGAYGQSGAT